MSLKNLAFSHKAALALLLLNIGIATLYLLRVALVGIMAALSACLCDLRQPVRLKRTYKAIDHPFFTRWTRA